MKSLSRNLLMGAILAALPMSGALACTVSQWNGAKTSVDADAKNPTASNSRYSGECGLNSTANAKYVGDNHPSNDAIYNARFYVYTGVNGTAEVFGAYDDENGLGNQLIGITYDSSAGEFQFSANGASGNLAGIEANKWYSIEFAFDADGADGANSFSADVAGAAGFSGSPAISGTPANSGVESARLGWINGSGSGRIDTDEFESTRGVAIGRLCRGDSNSSGNISASDRTAITLELALPPDFASGQPDCNEDGRVTAGDRFCVTEKLAIFDPIAQCE